MRRKTSRGAGSIRGSDRVRPITIPTPIPRKLAMSRKLLKKPT